MSQPLLLHAVLFNKNEKQMERQSFPWPLFCYKAFLQELFLKMPVNMSIWFRGFFSSCAIQEDSKMT